MLKEDCVFCKIIKGEIPSKKYYEDDNFLAIFDIDSISEADIIILSKNHYPDTKEMPEEEWKEFCTLARNLAEKYIKEIKADGYSFLINQGEAAQSAIAHRPHVHIIPRRFNDGIKIDPR